jgi:surfactin synthase thioesterase subunit
VCFPYAGGNAHAYRTWPAALAPRVEVCAVELPGHGSRLSERPHTRLERLLDELVPAVAPLRDRPLALFGHSMGALVAFELARRLESAGAPPLHLFVSGCSPPQLPQREWLHTRPREEIIEAVRGLDGTPSEVFAHPELLDLLIPMLRADLELIETHVFGPGRLLACPVTAFAGASDPAAPAAFAPRWGDHASGPFESRIFEGGHFFLRTAEAEVLESIRAVLTTASGPDQLRAGVDVRREPLSTAG